MDWGQFVIMMITLSGALAGVHHLGMKEIRSDMARHEAEIQKQNDRLDATNVRIDKNYEIIIDMLKDRKV